jgi:hypothetical protein
MPDEMRAELEASARKRGWSLAQDLLWRVRVSLTKGHEEHNDRALRALCYVISEMARKHLHTASADRAGEWWHRDPFTFKAFRLGVANLLETLQPPGELRRPRTKDGRYLYGTETPESIADYAAKETKSDLFYDTPQSLARLKAALRSYSPHVGEWMMDELEKGIYAMSNARRDFGIDEPKEPWS